MDNKTDIFLKVIENHKGIIYKIANSYCKVREERKDLTQEIIIQLWESFDKYDKQFKFSTWIYRIALNTAISFYRKDKTRKGKTIEFSPIIQTSLIADEPALENPDLNKLQVFIQELREIDKAIILLYLDGLSQKEIAEIIGISPSNVGTKLSRIKNILLQKFQTIKI